MLLAEPGREGGHLGLEALLVTELLRRRTPRWLAAIHVLAAALDRERLDLVDALQVEGRGRVGLDRLEEE